MLCKIHACKKYRTMEKVLEKIGIKSVGFRRGRADFYLEVLEKAFLMP